MAEATEVDVPSIDDAINLFDEKLQGFDESERYYHAEERDLAVGIATPPPLRALLAQVGVPRIYVNAVAERLVVEGFRLGDAGETDEEMWSWFKANRLDIQSQMGFRDALVYGRSYITVAAPDEDGDNPLAVPEVPRIQVESPKNLYAEINPRTREVDWAIRVIKDEQGDIVAATLYSPNDTQFYQGENGELSLVDTVSHGLGVVPVVPMINSHGVGDLVGASLITPEVRSITDAMSRTMMNLQVTSELMATPQRMIFGATADELMEQSETALELYTSSYITVEDPSATAMQLPAAELRNFTESISHMLKMAAAYTGLPPQYLSYSNDSPASAEAIRSAESRLVRMCESLAGVFGDAWERAMRVALLVQGTQLTLDHFRLEAVWRDPGTPTYQAKADAASKLYANGTGPIPKEQARIDMGYTPEQRRQMQEWDEQSEAAQLSRMYSPSPESDAGEVDVEPGADGEGAAG
ncbi:phage portal protein [Corynebacterium pseudodiphtheriticum]|uniref:phage portal protein n=1 Tax=Corynebacterium pseudodiphtheriticum TaxID=37637 RepID=UPI0020C11056|nr:phage portal protein [Corynebacterium pseudodiphtheriticum]UQV56376.1 phage portal protein [Corynebacterium pseudodiphtheriticum]